MQPVRVPLIPLPPARSTAGVKRLLAGKKCPPRAGRQREVVTLHGRALQFLVLSRMGHRGLTSVLGHPGALAGAGP